MKKKPRDQSVFQRQCMIMKPCNQGMPSAAWFGFRDRMMTGTSEEGFREIYRIFREERSKLFNRGVVLREFIPIVEKGSDVRGLPIIEETRLFFWKGKVVVPPKAESPSAMDEIARWEMIAARFRSSFMTIDVAHLQDGSWKIVEVGDGGVSGLPVGLDPERFFAALWNIV